MVKSAKRFLAGAAAIVVFHQALVALYHAMGRFGQPPWDWSPTAPFGLPAIVWVTAWGGLWALLIFALAERLAPRHRALAFVAMGAVLPTLTALGVVLPLKGQALPQPWLPALAGTVILNAVWAIGTLLFARLAGALRVSRSPGP